jgi:phytoene dehydrogenase-like protein
MCAERVWRNVAGNWADPDFKNAFADRCFSIVDEFAPGFSSSVIGRDVLTPLDLERIFGMHAQQSTVLAARHCALEAERSVRGQ